MTPADREARINKFVDEFGYGDAVMDEELRKGVVQLLTDLGYGPKSDAKPSRLLTEPLYENFGTFRAFCL